jgi:hypothetical protein
MLFAIRESFSKPAQNGKIRPVLRRFQRNNAPNTPNFEDNVGFFDACHELSLIFPASFCG